LIPAAEQKRIRTRFRNLTNRVRVDFFTFLKEGEKAAPGRECPPCDAIQEMLQDLSTLSERVALTVHDIEGDAEDAQKLGVDKIPATVIRGTTNRALRYFGSPSNKQFPVFIETLIAASSGELGLEDETVRHLRKLRSDVSVRVLVTPNCVFSPVMTFNALRFGLQSTRVKVDVIDVSQFPQILRRIGRPVVPLTVVNDTYATPGILSEADMAQAVLQAAEGQDVSVLARPQPRRQAPGGPRRTPGGLILPR
jgi:thiol-disulfide isomerase/thioredoxin